MFFGRCWIIKSADREALHLLCLMVAPPATERSTVLSCLACAHCGEDTEYSLVFLQGETPFLCDSCLEEQQHHVCREGRECVQCDQLGERLRCRWRRQSSILQLQGEMEGAGRWGPGAASALEGRQARRALGAV